MFSSLVAGSSASFYVLCGCLILVLAFEFSNGFHDTANAVATVIYTNSLKPIVAVVWSGIMNFLGVLLGGIAVAYALVQILPPEVLSPPDANPAVGMLAALFLTALIWNVGTWALSIPNSSSHALIGSLVGISIAAALKRDGSLHEGVDWAQIVKVLEALLFSPFVGFVFSALLFLLIRMLFKDKHLYEPPDGDKPPVWWMRGVLILTCTGVSFAHGTNDGQKSIGLIMLTIIGLAPLTFAINHDLDPSKVAQLPHAFEQAGQLIGEKGDSRKNEGVTAAADAARRVANKKDLHSIPDNERVPLRADTNRIIAELKSVGHDKQDPNAERDRGQAEALQKQLTLVVNFAPWWVRILSAICLGLGTMVGYKRIVKTLGERLGKQRLAPAQGASAELVSAAVIGIAAFTGGPVSTTHVVTSGIAGTMVGSGAGVHMTIVRQIAAAWILTLPATILISGGLFYLFA